MNIGETLKQNREKRGYTVHRLAEMLNLDEQLVIEWEENKSQPDLTSSLLLSKLYNLPIEDFFCDFDIGDVLSGKMKEDFEYERWLNKMSARTF